MTGQNGSELSGRNEPMSVRSWSKLAQGATLPAAHRAHARKRFNCTWESIPEWVGRAPVLL